MKYAGMPMGMWTLFAGSFRKDLTLASGGPYCDCGYHKRNKQNKGSTAPA